MKKAILFDADGVVIHAEMFSLLFQREHGVLASEMLPFYTGIFQDCMVGKADLREVIQPWLEKWHWTGTTDEFLQAWFAYEERVDRQMIDLILSLREQAVKCYLATNQEKYRTQYLRNEMGFANIFDGIFSSAEIGSKKPDPKFYEFVCNSLEKDGITRDEIVYTDDTIENVESARTLGIESFLFTERESFREYLKHFFELNLESKFEKQIN